MAESNSAHVTVQRRGKRDVESPTRRSMDQRLRNVKSLIDKLHAKNPKHGRVAHPSVEFTSTQDAGVTVKVTEAVNKGELLLCIPEEELVGFSTITKDVYIGDDKVSLGNLVQGMGDKLVESDVLEPRDIVLAVLIMYLLANETRFDSVVATWPSAEDLEEQLLFDDKAKKAVKNTYLERIVSDSQKALDEVFHNTVFPELKKAKVLHLFVKERVQLAKKKVWRAFHTAFLLANSRSHEGKPNAVSANIIPLVDLLNGLPEQCNQVNVEILSLAEGFLPWSKGSSRVTATRDIQAGEELYISYGEMPSFAFVYKYGFCPKQLLTEHHLMADVVAIRYPPEMAPPPKDTNRVMAVSAYGLPTSKREIKTDFVMDLTPPGLAAYSADVNGIGSDRLLFQQQEPPQLGTLRQYVMLAQLADKEMVNRFLATKRIKGNIPPVDVGRLLVKIMDYNLQNLATQSTSTQELQLLEEEEEFTPIERAAIMSRICYRETLAQWRHVLCRRYAVFSAADDSQIIRDMLDTAYATVSEPECLKGGGCSVCGRTVGARQCSQCKQTRYCCRDHQRKHWRMHKHMCRVAAAAAAP